MKSGVSFPSYASLATWSALAGYVTTTYPASNLSDLSAVQAPMKALFGGPLTLSFTLPAAQSIQFLALIGHNAGAGKTMQIKLYSGLVQTAPNLVHDSGAVMIASTDPNASLYRKNRPYLLTNAVTAQSGTITFSSQATPWMIGAVEISGWWSWPDVMRDREFGLEPRAYSTSLAQGVDHVTRAWSPRIVSGSREMVDQSEVDVTLLDFQMEKGNNAPFIWCWDTDDSATWPRECILVTNAELSGGVVYEHLVGQLSFSFVEHLG